MPRLKCNPESNQYFPFLALKHLFSFENAIYGICVILTIQAFHFLLLPRICNHYYFCIYTQCQGQSFAQGYLCNGTAN